MRVHKYIYDICMCIYMYIHTHCVYTNAYIYVCIYVITYIHKYVCVCARAHVYEINGCHMPKAFPHTHTLQNCFDGNKLKILQPFAYASCLCSVFLSEPKCWKAGYLALVYVSFLCWSLSPCSQNNLVL